MTYFENNEARRKLVAQVAEDRLDKNDIWSIPDYINKKFRRSRWSLFMDSISFFIIFDLIFGIPIIILSIVIFGDPINEDDRKSASLMLGMGIFFTCVGILAIIPSNIKRFKLKRAYKKDDIEFLLSFFNIDKKERNAPKLARKEFARWAILKSHWTRDC